MHRITTLATACLISIGLYAQDSTISDKNKRLDFARTYFELGGSFMPSFTGKQLQNGQINTFQHSASINQYLTWGAFHFWGHGEFYVNIPLSQNLLNKDNERSFKLIHSVATGFRIYPWAMKEKSLRPYVGFSWGALDFQQIIKPEEYQPRLSKDIMLNFDAGITYQHRKFGGRIGLNYFPDNEWKYPLNETVKEKITSPPIAVHFGLFYTFDSSKNSKHKETDSWNDFPRLSKLSYNATKSGDFFVAIAPSSSYSLNPSKYNQSEFPYLKEKLLSKPYFDLAVGYQFNQSNMFLALTYKNPRFETSGFGTKQRIEKNSLTLEAAKFLTDYTGFAPFIGVNLALDQLKYTEDTGDVERELQFKNQWEPGLTIGWDIVPGKTSEALILRTNLRWYPFSSFEVDNTKFDFSQLEYNLIQLVFYPDRLIRNKNIKS